MRKKIRWVLLMGVLAAVGGSACAGRKPASDGAACPGGAKKLILDSGHSPVSGGAISATGRLEVIYNDLLTAAVETRLRSIPCLAVVKTRAPETVLELKDRVAIAERERADLFLSLHHDSAQEQLMEKVEFQGTVAWRTRRPIRGHSVFVSRENARFDESVRFARALGRALGRDGRKPTLHHAEAISGESRELLDPALGVYQYPTLAVLRLPKCPSVLVEAGVITDVEDEAYVADPVVRERLAEQIAAGVSEFMGGR